MTHLSPTYRSIPDIQLRNLLNHKERELEALVKEETRVRVEYGNLYKTQAAIKKLRAEVQSINTTIALLDQE